MRSDAERRLASSAGREAGERNMVSTLTRTHPRELSSTAREGEPWSFQQDVHDIGQAGRAVLV